MPNRGLHESCIYNFLNLQKNNSLRETYSYSIRFIGKAFLLSKSDNIPYGINNKWLIQSAVLKTFNL